MTAYVTASSGHDMTICAPLDGNTCYLTFDINKYGCLDHIPRVVRSSFIRKASFKEIRISDELLLNVRTVTEVARAAEPLLSQLIQGLK